MATPSAPVETKVRAATVVATVVGLVVTVLNAVGTNSALLGSTPAWLQSIVTLLAPPLAVFLAGWAAPHTPRSAPAPVVSAPTPVVITPPLAVDPGSGV
jgi:hypothetical protein